MIVFARIDQRAAAEASGLTIHPMQLLFFGDLRGGTPLMTAFLQQRHCLPQTPFVAVEALIEKAPA